jgi:hypothetical protein
MTQQATALIKFQCCDFSAEMAKSADGYDTAVATAWIAPFTIAQKDYWAQQPIAEEPGWLPAAIINYGITFDSFGGRLCNKYADDLATTRNTAIAAVAQSAYNTCVAGGASAPVSQSVEAGFRLSLHTQLTGGGTTSDVQADTHPKARLMIPFASANPDNANPSNHLSWQPFYRLGSVSDWVTSPLDWEMSIQGGGASYFSGIVQYGSVLVIKIPKVSEIMSTYEQYLPAPDGYTLNDIGGASPAFNAIVSSLDIGITAHIFFPDGGYSSHTTEYYADTVTSDGHILDADPFGAMGVQGLTVNCEVEGVIDTYYTIDWYRAGTVYEESQGIQCVRGDDGVLRNWRRFSGASSYELIPWHNGIPQGIARVHSEVVYIPQYIDYVDADFIFDYDNNALIRYVLKLSNTITTRPLGVIVNIGNREQFWVSLQPGETRFFSGVLPMVDRLLHPYLWGSSDFSYDIYDFQGNPAMRGGVERSSSDIRLWVTVSITNLPQPETNPVNLSENKMVVPAYWAGSEYASTIKAYTYPQNVVGAYVSKSISKTISKPSHLGVLTTDIYFPAGASSGKVIVLASESSRTLTITGEKRRLSGGEYVWDPVAEEDIPLTEAIIQQFNTALGITTELVLDYKNARWFTDDMLTPWFDKVYTTAEVVIDDAAARSAMNSVLTSNAAEWPDYRNITAHSEVKFGVFASPFRWVPTYTPSPFDPSTIANLSPVDSVSTKLHFKLA